MFFNVKYCMLINMIKRNVSKSKVLWIGGSNGEEWNYKSYFITLLKNEVEIKVKDDNNKIEYKFNEMFVVNDIEEICENWGIDVQGNVFAFVTLSIKYKCYMFEWIVNVKIFFDRLIEFI